MITFTTEHVQSALDKLLQQYKGKPKFEGFISALASQVQDTENALKQLFEERSIDSAVGVNLDVIGEIVGLARTTGQTDEEYRDDLKVKVVQNLNEGTPEEFIAAAIYFIGANVVEYTELYPAAVSIVADVLLTDERAAVVRTILESFLPAGVSIGNFGFVSSTNPFRFDIGNGFGDDADPELGGLLAGAY
jgi:hypothetical protein